MRSGQFFRHLLRHKSFHVLIAIIIGALIGHFAPATGVALKVLGDIFIGLVKMLIPPIIFLSIATGIRGSGNLKQVGRLGLKSLLYFEVVTTFAMIIGLIVVNVLKPGVGVSTAAATAADTAKTAAPAGIGSLFQSIIPESFFGALASGSILQILLIAILFGVANTALGSKGESIHLWMKDLLKIFFQIVELVMHLAPIGALGAMAYTLGKFGINSLTSLAHLMAAVYLTMILFIFVVLGGILKYFNLSIWRFLVYIREEIFLVLGTSSSESALPRMLYKLEKMGCAPHVVGLVIPAGYSFNLDGTSIYMSMATLFIAQAYGIDLSLTQQLSILAILMLTSKGAAGVTGSGFITLAATLAATHVLPIEGMALVLGVDRFMSEARSITNLIGNGVASVAMAKWEKAFDHSKLEPAYASESRQ